LIEAGHLKQARAIVEPWIRDEPNDTLANFLLSQIRNAFHDRQSPLALAEKAVPLDGSVAKYHRQLAEVLGVTAQHSGMLQQIFLARRFKTEIDTALAEDPDDLQARRDLMEYYLLAPGIVGGDRAKAREAADHISRLNAAEGYLAQARLAESSGETGRVEALYQKAVEAQPGNYRARIALANFYLSPSHRNDRLAEQQAREAIHIDRGRVEGYTVLAEVEATRARWPELETMLADAEKEVPDDLTPCYRAAVEILARGRDLPRAEALLRKYLAAEPEGNAPTLADAHWQLGLVLEKEDRQHEAIPEWRESLRLDATSPAKHELKLVTKDR
jgi:tetratricopeptide (TPR) repeat protein